MINRPSHSRHNLTTDCSNCNQLLVLLKRKACILKKLFVLLTSSTVPLLSPSDIDSIFFSSFFLHAILLPPLRLTSFCTVATTSQQSSTTLQHRSRLRPLAVMNTELTCRIICVMVVILLIVAFVLWYTQAEDSGIIGGGAQ